MESREEASSRSNNRESQESEQTYSISRTITDEVNSDEDISNRESDSRFKKSVSAPVDFAQHGECDSSTPDDQSSLFSATIFRIERNARRSMDLQMEKRASAGDQNERPRRYIKKKITGFDADMVSRMDYLRQSQVYDG